MAVNGAQSQNSSVGIGAGCMTGKCGFDCREAGNFSRLDSVLTGARARQSPISLDAGGTFF
jgi:hypothetical protein